MTQFLHGLLPERGAALFEQLGASVQGAVRRPVAKSPSAELRQHGAELDGGFGQAVAGRYLSVSGRKSQAEGAAVLRQVAEGVLVHQSEFMQSNAVVVQGRDGELLIDPGILGAEIACIASDLRQVGQPVVAGFSTHPHWDHLLWHAELGSAPRYGTARGATAARDRLSDPGAKARIATLIPPDIAEQVPLDLLGLITGLPAEVAEIPWDGPSIRIIEHQAHAPGHASLWIEERGSSSSVTCFRTS